MGWFEPSNVIDVDINDGGGQYLIAPLEFTDTKAKYIRLHRGDLQPVYYIEFRQPVLYDAHLPNIGLASAGALIHWTHAEVRRLSGGDTQLVDTTPGSNPGPDREDFYDAALVEGDSFVEQTLGFTVTTLVVNPAGLLVDIQPSTPLV